VPLAAACAVVLAVGIWRGPATTGDVSQPIMDSAEAQQVEDALSDVDMLRQLGVTEASASARQSL
jgi:hypothetical protein